MKRYKITLTENQIRILDMVFQEARDANSYQDGDDKFMRSYNAVLKDLTKPKSSIYKQLKKQGGYE